MVCLSSSLELLRGVGVTLLCCTHHSATLSGWKSRELLHGCNRAITCFRNLLIGDAGLQQVRNLRMVNAQSPTPWACLCRHDSSKCEPLLRCWSSVAFDSLRRSRWANIDRQTPSRQYRHNAFLEFHGDILQAVPEGHFRPRDRAINATSFSNTQSTPITNPTENASLLPLNHPRNITNRDTPRKKFPRFTFCESDIRFPWKRWKNRVGR